MPLTAIYTRGGFMGKVHIDTQSLEQHIEEMEELRLALLEVIPGLEATEWSGKGKTPEQIHAVGKKMDKTAYSLNYLINETIQVLKKTKKGIAEADQSVANALKILK